jgi:hypothetical protein
MLDESDIITGFSNIHIRALMNSLIDDTNKCTSIKMHTVTYNALRSQDVSIFFRSSSGNLHNTYI